MKEKYIQNLEYPKVAAMASERAVCQETKEMILNETLITRFEDVQDALTQTDVCAELLLKNGNPRISGCTGATQAVGRAQKGGVLSPGELISVNRALKNFSTLHSWYSQRLEAEQTVLDDYFFAIQPQPNLQKRIDRDILSESEIADSASDALANLRRKIRQTESSIRDKLDEVVKNPDNSKHLQDAVVSLRNGRFVVPVRAEQRAEIGGVIHDVSSSGNTIFVEPTAVVQANAKVMQLRNQEQQEIERILRAYSDEVVQIAPFFEASYNAMLQIDLRVAKAELGLWMNGIKPAVNKEMKFCLNKAKHPLLGKDVAVPITIELGNDYNALIVTGPNTGGKTVTLKTAGLLSMMAQHGYLIPAHDSSSVCVFENILVDIGDEQSIEQSLSTFSGHMKNIGEILQEDLSRSLVLLDELGAGTDPSEGAALAVAIIEQMRAMGARIMATTHYAELKMYALETSVVQNASCEFDIETLQPTYKLIVGVPGKSNAFAISEKLGIPKSIIENAKGNLSEEERRFDMVLAQLEDVKLELKEQQEEIARLEYEASHQLESAQKKREELIQQGQNELDMARRQANKLADDVQNQAYGLLDEIKQLEKDKRVANAKKAQRAREIVKHDSEKLYVQSEQADAIDKDNFTPLKQVTVGQEVYVPSMAKIATVSSLPNKANDVEVRMGVLRTKIPLTQLAAVPKNAGKQQGGKKRRTRQGTANSKVEQNANSAPKRTSQMELNLLGKTVDEALMETDLFIDESVLKGLPVVYIIHGRGTGALRKAIQQHLKTNRSVKSFRLGVYGEGEDGVTVAELR